MDYIFVYAWNFSPEILPGRENFKGGEVGFKSRIRMWGLDAGQTNPVFGKVQAINFS